MTIKRIIRKKKKNEAGEALAKVSGAEELEMAATIFVRQKNTFLGKNFERFFP